MNQLQERRAHLRKLIHTLFTVFEYLNKGFRVQQFVNRAITAFFDLDHIIRNGRRNPQDESSPGQFPLALNGRKGIFPIDFDDVFPIQTVYLSVCPLADDLTVLQGDHAIDLLDLHHLCKSGHVQDIVKIGTDVDQAGPVNLLFHPEHHPQSRTAHIVHPVAVQHDGVRLTFFQLFHDFSLKIRRIDGIHMLRRYQGKYSVFIICLHIAHPFAAQFIPHGNV